MDEESFESAMPATNILLVEDEEQVRSLLRRRLEGAGYVVVEASSAEEAILRYQDCDADVVVTDIMLPGKSGLDLIDQLQRTFPGVRVIAMSGALAADVPTLLRQSKELGVVYGLPKPFTTAQLLEAIDKTLAAPAMSPTLGEIADMAEKRQRIQWGVVVAALLVLVGLIFAITQLRR